MSGLTARGPRVQFPAPGGKAVSSTIRRTVSSPPQQRYRDCTATHPDTRTHTPYSTSSSLITSPQRPQKGKAGRTTLPEGDDKRMMAAVHHATGSKVPSAIIHVRLGQPWF